MMDNSRRDPISCFIQSPYDIYGRPLNVDLNMEFQNIYIQSCLCKPKVEGDDVKINQFYFGGIRFNDNKIRKTN